LVVRLNKAVKTRLVMLLRFSMDHKTTLRIVGVLGLALVAAGVGYFQIYGGKSILESLYEIFTLAIGVGGTVCLQLSFGLSVFFLDPFN
jgi:hypothetical protein